MLKPGLVIGGRYKIDRQIGRGGFGAVFLSSHIATRQEVVVKVLKPDLGEDDTHVKRFFNEARASSLLSHPHTVRIFDFGQTDTGLLFIAMEHLSGRELAQALKAAPESKISAARAARIGIAVLKSLSEAHSAGLVHRDLKPDNIFLCKVHGEEEFVKVIDFGIAKPTDQSADAGLTKTGFTVGTPKYMSPEQVLNRPLDGRSDLYALGVILYQCVAGEVPLAGASPMETLVAHMQTEPVHLKEKVPGLPRTFTDLVMQALRKAPFERFRDADEMREALEATLPELDQAAPRAIERHTNRPSAKMPQASTEATESHGEVIKVGSGAPVTRPQAKPPAPATGTQQARPPTGQTPQAASSATATATTGQSPQTGHSTLTTAEAGAPTEVLEHATMRVPYLPQTMTLPTQTAPQLKITATKFEDTDQAPAPVPSKPLPWPAIGIGVAVLAFAVLSVTIWLTVREQPNKSLTSAPTTILTPSLAPPSPALAAPREAPAPVPTGALRTGEPVQPSPPIRSDRSLGEPGQVGAGAALSSPDRLKPSEAAAMPPVALSVVLPAAVSAVSAPKQEPVVAPVAGKAAVAVKAKTIRADASPKSAKPAAKKGSGSGDEAL